MISVRPEKPEDREAVRAINERAFGQPQEADIVDRLRESCDDVLSLVATREGVVVGHILFSPVTLEQSGGIVEGMGLAPMAVMPEHQNRGIGTALIETGLAMLRDRRCPFVVVVGHPAYYPRFGFEPASRYGVVSQWASVPDEAFMMLVFEEGSAGSMSGVARFRKEIDEAM